MASWHILTPHLEHPGQHTRAIHSVAGDDLSLRHPVRRHGAGVDDLDTLSGCTALEGDGVLATVDKAARDLVAGGGQNGGGSVTRVACSRITKQHLLIGYCRNI